MGEPVKYTRLSVNLALDTAAALKQVAAHRGWTITDTIRRCIALMKFVDTERSNGNKIAVLECENGRERVREVLFFDV